MNSLEEIALKVAKDAFAEIYGPSTTDPDPAMVKWISENARRLVAALGAQKPVAWRHEYTSDLDSQAYHHSMMIDKNAEQLEYSMKAYNLKVVQSNSLFAAPVLPSVPEGWIDVKDRLPDTAGVFLVICDRWVQSYHPIIGVFNRDFDSPYPWSVPGTATVTHWMPLPAAPSPQEDKP